MSGGWTLFSEFSRSEFTKLKSTSQKLKLIWGRKNTDKNNKNRVSQLIVSSGRTINKKYPRDGNVISLVSENKVAVGIISKKQTALNISSKQNRIIKYC